jgi:hypothetical protein
VSIFSRGGKDESEPAGLAAIPLFWEWWVSEGRPQADRGTSGAGWGSFADEIADRLEEIDPELQWETGPGIVARHGLTITSGGVSDLRPLAERIFRGAPPADETWQYFPARQADQNGLRSKLEIAETDVDLSLARVAITLDAGRLKANVSVYHPDFGAMPEKSSRQVTFLLLDWLLGEDGVERWLGAVETVTARPADALPTDALPETVLALAARTGPDQWALLEGESEGKPLMVLARRPLKWIDNPLLDQHLAVGLPFEEKSDSGYAEGETLDRLRGFEERLTTELSERALLVVVETRDGMRTLHLYADHTDSGIAPLAEQVAATWPGARVKLELDPGWRHVSAFS